MKMKKKLIATTACMLLLSLTGCSTLASNTQQYFSQVGSKVNSLLDSRKANTDTDSAPENSSMAGERDSNKVALSTPADFTVDADGNYSFRGVADTDYYIICMYDSASESGEYRYISENINDNGESTYTGNLSDSITYAYGNYRIEVVAYPKITDKEHRKSDAATCEFSLTGTVEAPQLAYMWDYFTETLDFQLTNIASYQHTAYPTLITLTLTDTENSADTITLTLENPSLEENLFSVETTEFTMNTTYSISADVEWDPNAVETPNITVDVGTVTISDSDNAISEGYGYLTGVVYTAWDYPEAEANFDVSVGGSIGTWYGYSPYGENRGEANYVNFGVENIYYTAVPIAANSGAKYSFAVEGRSDVGYVTLDKGDTTEAIYGTLDIFEDGTLTLTIDYQLMGVIPQSGALMELPGSKVNGTWTENGDGTINLSYNRNTAVLTG